MDFKRLLSVALSVCAFVGNVSAKNELESKSDDVRLAEIKEKQKSVISAQARQVDSSRVNGRGKRVNSRSARDLRRIDRRRLQMVNVNDDDSDLKKSVGVIKSRPVIFTSAAVGILAALGLIGFKYYGAEDGSGGGGKGDLNGSDPNKKEKPEDKENVFDSWDNLGGSDNLIGCGLIPDVSSIVDEKSDGKAFSKEDQEEFLSSFKFSSHFFIEGNIDGIEVKGSLRGKLSGVAGSEGKLPGGNGGNVYIDKLVVFKGEKSIFEIPLFEGLDEYKLDSGARRRNETRISAVQKVSGYLKHVTAEKKGNDIFVDCYSLGSDKERISETSLILNFDPATGKTMISLSYGPVAASPEA